MIDTRPSHLRLERLLAVFLHYGTLLASGVIGVGLLMAWIKGGDSSPDLRWISVGIGLFILMPFLRVVLMLAVFLRERDYRFSAVAALVLTILILGFVVGWLGQPVG